MKKLYEKYLTEAEEKDMLGQYQNVVQIWHENKIRNFVNFGNENIAIFSINTGSVKEGFYDEEMALVKIKSIDIEIIDDNYDLLISQKGQGALLGSIEESLQEKGEKEFKAETTFVSDDETEDSLRELVRMIIKEVKKKEQQTYSLNLEDFYICVFLNF